MVLWKSAKQPETSARYHWAHPIHWSILQARPNASHEFYTFSFAEDRLSLLSAISLKLAELSKVRLISAETFLELSFLSAQH